ncbi:hypothetical protein Micbo1qcDRAFT_124458 [Microdochium bolleyi]|uniref:CHY-type domain-containing protein n=1 Tax=Microdochium bolleyi TaxID=196109 RepID=A0A136IR36_9PEZI|nr:hypothetical protein Micbo1qcDRAFT_124458 [Microdochium bolleyi]
MSAQPASGTAPSATAEPKPIVVHGVDTTAQTQCAHWHSARDIIAIRHACCGEYYACISCHEALASHAAAVWRRADWDTTKAVLCGSCRAQLTIAEYLACESTCPRCQAAFNPGCARHYDLYFEKQDPALGAGEASKA